jgi:hypothetical protein
MSVRCRLEHFQCLSGGPIPGEFGRPLGSLQTQLSAQIVIRQKPKQSVANRVD